MFVEAESHVALLGLKLAMQQGMILNVCLSGLYLSRAGIAGVLSLGLSSAGHSIPASPHQENALKTEGQLHLHKGGFLKSGGGCPSQDPTVGKWPEQERLKDQRAELGRSSDHGGRTNHLCLNHF